MSSTDRFRRPVYVDMRTGRLFADPLIGGGRWPEVQPGGAATIRPRWTKTAAGGETSISGADDNGANLEYAPGGELVYLNGVLLTRSADYSAMDGLSINGLAALAPGDVLTVLAFQMI